MPLFVVILAAGASRRFGRPKQLALYRGTPMLQHTISVAIALGEQVVVVLGCGAESIATQVDLSPVKTVINPNWEAGMSTSIRAGLEVAMAHGATAVLFLTGDQPFVTQEILEKMIASQVQSGKPIICCGYSGTLGIPVLFDQVFFPELLTLSGDTGAKKVALQHPEALAIVDFESGAIDIDTPADYQKLHTMISVADAKTIIRRVSLEGPLQQYPLAEAAGHTLATDVFATCDIPAFAQSSMDGYAFAFEGWQTYGRLHLHGESAAGGHPGPLKSTDAAMRIFTGAPLPAGADTVIEQENVVIEHGQITITRQGIARGTHVRPQGSEIGQGALALSAGTWLSPAAIGFLAGIGLATVPVVAPPRISIITTGNELQSPGQPLAYGQVYESNSALLKAALHQLNLRNIAVFRAADQLDALSHILQHATDTSDLVLLTGGVSVGDYDFVLKAAALCGVEQHFYKIKQKPGKPLFFGKKERCLVFGLPGNPASVLTCFYQYVLEALSVQTRRSLTLREATVIAGAHLKKNPGLTQFLKGHFDGAQVVPLTGQESYRLSSFAVANCLIVIPEHLSEVAAGDPVTIQFLPSYG